MARVNSPSSTSYLNVNLAEHGYMSMPWIEDSFVSYLSPGAASSWKASALPSKSCQTSSKLVSKAYVVAGQAGGAFPYRFVLQAYQAVLLKDLVQGEVLSPDTVLNFRHATDLSLRATKQVTRAVGPIAELVATERHLWLKLLGLKEKERAFLLNAWCHLPWSNGFGR